ncbi:MAG: lipocalin family protein, partial [Gammaproteobacteria bacterium]
DGGVRVLNRGYSIEYQAWEDAEGKAYFASSPDVGHLKVSFFGPFYGSYVIIELDRENYEYAFVTSYNKKYLWLLARQPQVEQALMDKFLATAKANGYAVDELIFVEHD